MKKAFSIQRRITRALAGAALLAGAAFAQAADKPSLITVLVGYPAGAGSDTAARIYADALGKIMNTTVVVDNKPGAGGQIAAIALKNAPAEPPTVMLTMDHQVVMIPLITKNPGFDVEKDMTPVARLLTYYVCLAVPGSAPQKTLQEYVDAVKAKPDLGNFGIPAPGSQAQFVGHVIGTHYKVTMTPVPYRGAAPAIVDVIGGQVPAVVVPCDALTEHAKAGKLRILAIAADKRSPNWPEVPTFKELGVNMPTDNFLGIYASKSMKPELLKQIVDASRQMFQSPQTVDRFNSTLMTAAYAEPADVSRMVQEASKFWGEQVRLTNFQAE